MRIWVVVAVASLMAAPFAFVEEAFSAQQYSVAVGSARGTMGRMGAGMVELINKKQNDFKISVVPGGGGRANPARVGGGGANFGYSFSNFTAAAVAGKPPFKRAFPNLRGVATFFSSCYHQYVAKELYESGYTTWEDIINSKKPLKVGIAKKGTSTEYVAQLITAHFGTSYKKLTRRGYKLTFPGAGGMSRAIRSRQIDFYFHNSGDPNGAGIQATLGRDLRFMRMTDEVKKLLAGHSFTPCTIPGGIYKGNPNPTKSMGLSGVLLTTDKMNANHVYSLLKIMSSNRKFLGNVHKIYKSWDPKTAWKNIGAPLHEGAKRFYREIGAMN